MARIFWILGITLFLAAIALVATADAGTGAITDYRVWLLGALGVLASVIGNVAQSLR